MQCDDDDDDDDVLRTTKYLLYIPSRIVLPTRHSSLVNCLLWSFAWIPTNILPGCHARSLACGFRYVSVFPKFSSLNGFGCFR